MAYKIGDLYWKLSADSTQLNNQLKKADVQAGKTGGSFKKMGASVKAGIAALAIAAVVGIGKVSKELVNAASRAEETQNKFNVTFSSIAESANLAAQELADNFGLSSVASQQLLSDTGDLLTGFGFTQRSALDLSKQVNELAVDLASFTNFSGGAEGASAALTKALLGERESIKSLGIAITEADIKQLAEEKGITGELDRQTKAVLTLELAIAQSKNAIGDFNRSQDSYANQMRIAQAATEDLRVALGVNLLPVATKGVTIFGQLVRKLADAVEQENKLTAARQAVAEGTATEEDRITVLNEEIELLERRVKMYNEEPLRQDRLTNAEYERRKAIRDSNRARLDALYEQRRGLYLLSIAEKDRAAAAEEAARVAEEAAKREEEEQAAKDAYWDKVEAEYNKTAQGQIDLLRKEIAEWEEYNKTAVRSKVFVEEIIASKKAQLAQLTEEINLVDELQNSYDKEVEILQKKNELKLISDEEYQELREQLELDFVDKLLQIDDTSLAGYQEFLDARLAKLAEAQDEELTSWEEFQKSIETIGSTFDFAYNQAFSFFSAVNNLIQATTSAQIEALEREKDALLEYYGLAEEQSDNRYTNQREQAEQELDDLRDNLDKAKTIEERNDAIKALADKQADVDEIIRKEALEEQKLAIEEDFNRKKADLEYKAELYAWRLNLLSATASAAQAILTALSTAGNIYAGIALAGLAGTVGAVNIAAVAAAKPTPPSYQVGAWELPEDQLAQVHEGEMIIPKPFAESLRENAVSSGPESGMGSAVSVNVYSLDQVETEETESATGDKEYRVFVGAAKKAFQNGEFDRVITQRYTTSRRGIA